MRMMVVVEVVVIDDGRQYNECNEYEYNNEYNAMPPNQYNVNKCIYFVCSSK